MVRGSTEDAKAPTLNCCLLLILAAALLALALFAPAAPAATLIAGPGNGAGQVNDPESTAVDPSSGILYVGENSGDRISEFDPSKPAGERFIRAFGWGVRNGTAALQTCTAVTGCQKGSDGPAAGQIRPGGMAVDPTTHNLYVSDFGNYRVEEFTPAGEFVLTFGHEVDKTTHADVCTAASHDTCGAGVVGSGPGEFGHTGLIPTMPLAFDPAGHLWVGDVDRLEEFSSAGAFLSEVAVPGEGSVSGLAIDAAGDFYSLSEEQLTGVPPNQVRNGAPKLRKYDSSGTPLDFTSLGTNALDEGGFPLAIALDGAGHIYVGDRPSFSSPYRFLEFDQESGKELEAFGAGEVIGQPGKVVGIAGGAIAFVASSLYAASGELQSYAPPPPGPLSRNLSAHPIRGTSATLRVILNSEGAEAHYRFQYLTQAQFEADGSHFGAGTQETAEQTLAASFEEPEVSAPVEGLSSETAYRFRLLAENANGKGNTEEAQANFTTTPPVSFDSLSASAVSAEGATLEAEINPVGTPSEYHFEYITQAALKQNEEEGHPAFQGASLAPVPDSSLPGVEEDLSVSQTISGLTPHTVYRYRAFAHNSGGSIGSGSLSFTTQSTAPFSLLDNRGWEMVSPPNKHGAQLQPIGLPGVPQAAADGNSITYLASGPTEGEPAGPNQVQALSARGSSSWSSHDISPPHGESSGTSTTEGQEYRAFSVDLSRALLQPFGGYLALSPQSTETTPYLRTDFAAGKPSEPCASECLRPLATAAAGVADVKAGAHFGLASSSGQACPPALFCGPEFLGATPDLSKVILDYKQAGLTSAAEDAGGLYQWSSSAAPTEALKLASILPTNKPAPGTEVMLGSQTVAGTAARGAITANGTRLVWSQHAGVGLESRLYLRDITLGQTVRLDTKVRGSGEGQATPLLQGASSDGSRIFFTDDQVLTPTSGGGEGGPDLYECAIAVEAGKLKCTLADLTPKAGEESADVLGEVLGSSEDASYVYLAANGVLAHNKNAVGEEAKPGNCTAEESPADATCNLYLLHNGATTFLGALSGEDEPDWSPDLAKLTARVSPNGHWAAFMSNRPLTGYDNRDVVSGLGDEEVFLYHAEGEGKLTCASCDPSAARPHGVKYSQIDSGAGGLAGGAGIFPSDAPIAANIPGWSAFEAGHALYQSRYLSNQGRLFFNAADSLVPADTNGGEDVYEFEQSKGPEAPASDNCTESSPTYSPVSGGCADLVSSGTSGEESAFLDASESGDDVFFLSAAKLSPRDEDSALDVYDARVGGGEEEFALTTHTEGAGEGTVQCSPPGGSCNPTYTKGTLVTLTAVPAAGSEFKEWKGACSGSGTCKVTISEARSVTAVFAIAAKPKFKLTVSKTGSGTITSTPAAINCGSGAGCEAEFEAGTEVELHQSPAAGSEFKEWSGACTGTGTCKVTMSAAKAVGAVFNPIPRSLAITKAGTGTGEVKCKANGGSAGACAASYPNATALEVIATAGAGSTFAGYSATSGSAAACTTSPCSFTIAANSALTATFNVVVKPKFALKAKRTGAGAGKVQSSAPPSPKISCGSECEAEFEEGTKVTLIQSADPGSRFTEWSGACTGAGACEVTMSAAKEVSARFEPLPKFKLSVTKSGTGAGTVTSSPAGISCGATCSAEYEEGKVVELKETASAGSEFTEWSGACTGTGTCKVTISAARSVGARFDLVPKFKLTVSKSGTGQGTVTSSPAGIDCGSTCSAEYEEGKAVELTASPEEGSEFLKWSGACTGTGTCQVTMSAAKSVSAVFKAPSTYRLLVQKSGTGQGTVTSAPPITAIDCGTECEARLPLGTEVELTATPGPGAEFFKWSGACVGTGPCEVTMSAARTVHATFKEVPKLMLSVTKTGSGTVTSSPAGIECGAQCTHEYSTGTALTLSATPARGYRLKGWEGCDSATASTCTVTMSAARSLSASFVLAKCKKGFHRRKVNGKPRCVRTKRHASHRRGARNSLALPAFWP